MARSRKIKAVFFDIGNVLVRVDAKSIVRKLAWALRSRPLRLARYLWKTDLVDSIERGRIGPHKLHRLFAKEFGYNGNFEHFKHLWCDHFTLETQTAGLLRRIAKTHKVYLLSNTNALHYDFIKDNYAFPSQVHGAVLSYLLGLRKPERAIYTAALRRARVKPREAVFIDDLKKNVKAARKAGMHALLYEDPVKLKGHLSALGVLDPGRPPSCARSRR